VRNVVLGIVVALAAAGCTASDVAQGSAEPGLQATPTASPYMRVTAGQVSGLVPDS